MKFALFIVLSLSAMAFAGPAFIKNNQISEQQQPQQTGSDAKSPAIDILKQWCFSSQMSQQELTASFKKLVQVVKSSPVDQTTESAVMSERICQGALVQKSQQTGQTVGQTGADAKAHELIKDVYMDALISCKSRECTEQLLKVISSQQVDTVRASYYMTRIAVSDKQSLKDEQEVKQFAESFIQEQGQQHQSEAVERQKLFATTSLIGKWIQDKPTDSEITEITKQVVKSIIDRYVKPVSQQEVEQYKQISSQQQQSQQVSQLAKKIAKRSAALKALANIPGHVLKQCQETEQVLVQLCQNKQELVTVRQSAIECLEQNDKQINLLKELTFDQQEPIEVRIAAYRALMTVAYQGDEQKNESAKEQMAQQIVDQVVKHCENPHNQQQDEQFVLYAISHLDNVRTSQQPEYQAVKEIIAENKQHYMQIQVLCKKFKQQLSDVRRSSRNYKLEQEFNQLESGLVLEGDIVYESKEQQQQQQQQHVLPKLVRVNMSMPIMGETVNVIEVTLRQNNMDEEILSVLKLAQNTKFNSESVSKVVDSFKSSVEKQQQQQRYSSEQEGPVEADLTIKVDGCTVVYLCVDDIKSAVYYQKQQQQQHQRNTRSVYSSDSIVDEVIEFLKRQPVNFNRGFNVNINERLAKVLDVDANILAGLRFESRAQGSANQGEFEIVAKMEPRFSFEAVVGPAKVSSKKLLQRVSTKSALGMRLRFKKDELVDIQLDLPMNTMELFTFETQLVEKTIRSSPFSYNYLPESIYGDEDIYSSYPIYSSSEYTQKLAKRSIYQAKKSAGTGMTSWMTGRKSATTSGQFSHSYETSDKVARAVGLRGQLHVVASPQDMGLLVSAIVQKYEPQMEGYRVKIEKVGRQGDLKQCLITVSTPNSRIERTMQVRIVKQSSQQRTLVKADVQSPVMSFGASVECVHDNRQYSIKTELVSRDQSRKQWRHALEAGLISGAPTSSGRLAQFSYKPYVSIDSTELSRPIQMQGQIAYQQSPKSVISYELKCSTSGDFVQGKLIIDQRDVKPSASYQMRKRSSMPIRRSMQSPLELILTKDLTFTHEMIGQVQEHAVKVHNMADWDCQKYAIKADSSVLYKNARKQETRVSASAKLDLDEQVFTVERKCPTDERKECTVNVVSKVRPSGHQMIVECRHQGRRQSLVAYKHNINAQQVGQNKYDVTMDVELVDTERNVNEKFTGRSRIQNERNQKTCQCELVSRNKLAKLNVDYQSLAQHQIQLELQSESFQHKTELRNTRRQFAVQSRTDNKQTGQTCLKMMVELNKPEAECKMVLEAPAKRTSVAADLKLASGKRSSIAVQTGRFASSAEFSFDAVSRKTSPFARSQSIFGLLKPAANLRFRSNLKDLANKQAYWMDSALIGAESQYGDKQQQQSFFRFDSPYYRTDIEFNPRDQETKLAAFARSKRSTNSYDSVYSTKDSSLYDTFASGLSDKLNLGTSKSWMLRSIISSPYAREQLKQQARRALFEYADRRQAHKHSFQYSPAEQRLTMDLLRQPNSEFVSANEFEPVRAKVDFSTSWSRPSTMSLESEFMNCDAEIKPFDDYESYAKLSALSRHRRSPFKKHDSEYRYKRDQGYKAWMKHVDCEDKMHSLSMESDVSPKKYAKVDFESDKHGKANWEHKWRHQKSKRSHDNEAVYENKFAMRREGPAENRWKHETSFQFEEPTRMIGGERRYRERRSIQPTNFLDQIEQYAEQKYGYSPIEYLKHTNARLMSQTSRPNAEQLYKLDFDYKPHQNLARLNLDMPENMLHSSQIELKPTESLYKLQSKLYNRMTNEPSYEFVASTKPYGLATAEQEPVFVDTEHPMFERSISKSSLAYTLFKQPMKLDYSDKWGRQASFDYDQSPLKSIAATSAGLRQKRAAVYYKDNSADFEHSSSYDFYPETYMTNLKPSYYSKQQQQQQTNDVAFKTETKYGPIVVRADSSEDTCVLDIVSPVMNAKLVGETGANMSKLYKLKLDNKSQRVQMSKLLREAPASIRECKLAKKFARKLDSGRFEHEAELLVSMVNEIFKVKSATKYQERPIVVIEGEWNQQQDKAYVKINGERINGQCMVDLVRKTADLMVEVDDKHTMQHNTRIVRTSDKFYSLESMTSYKSRPVLKLIGKVSAQIFEPSHLFARRHYSDRQQQQQQQQHKYRGQYEQQAAHVSTFEAVLYEPQEMHVTGQYDCDQKEARIVFKNVDEKRFQETLVRYDETSETFIVESRLSSANEGTVYATKARLSLPGLTQSEQCRDNVNAISATEAELYSRLSTIGPNSCQSEMIYSDKSGNWSAKYQPGDYITVSTPNTKQTINLTGNYYY